jgi:hypothetical protein
MNDEELIEYGRMLKKAGPAYTNTGKRTGGLGYHHKKGGNAQAK